MYNLPPPLNKKPPHKIRSPFLNIDFDGGTISALMKYPPSEANIVTIKI